MSIGAQIEKVANIGFFLVLGAWTGQFFMFALSLMGAGMAGIVIGYLILALLLSGIVAATVALTFIFIRWNERKTHGALSTVVATFAIAALYFIFFHPVI